MHSANDVLGALVVEMPAPRQSTRRLAYCSTASKTDVARWGQRKNRSAHSPQNKLARFRGDTESCLSGACRRDEQRYGPGTHKTTGLDTGDDGCRNAGTPSEQTIFSCPRITHIVHYKLDLDRALRIYICIAFLF